MGHYLDGEVRKGPSNKTICKLMLKGRQEAAHVKSYGKGELAKDLCKGPESKESLEFSTN